MNMACTFVQPVSKRPKPNTDLSGELITEDLNNGFDIFGHFGDVFPNDFLNRDENFYVLSPIPELRVINGQTGIHLSQNDTYFRRHIRNGGWPRRQYTGADERHRSWPSIV
jgi:hypothetical protein